MTDDMMLKRGRKVTYREREQVNFWIDAALYGELCAWAADNEYSAVEVLNASIACGLPTVMFNPDFIVALKSKFEKETA